MRLPSLFNDLSNLLFPRKCLICQGRLNPSEEHLCLNCLSQLPRPLYHKQKGNEMEQHFYGIIPIERATSYLFYTPDNPTHHILHAIKYYGAKKLAIYIGHCMGTHLTEKENRFFEDIDFIIPVPLSKERMRKRGYNQSQLLAEGLSQSTGIPVLSDLLIRTVDNPTQTRLSRRERWENVHGIFKTTAKPHAFIEGKHLLLIDDVATTGATLSNCAQAILKDIPNCRLSIATLALTSM
jgi:ComF family protein